MPDEEFLRARRRAAGAASMAEAVTLSGIGKQFGSGRAAREVLAGVDLEIAPGEFVALLGTSGCGKSTVLRIIAGLDAPTAGMVRLGGRPVRDVDPRCAIVFQEPRLFPWRTVAANVALGARAKAGSVAPAAILRRVGLAGYESAWPHELSGGMAQRAARARALVGQPQVVLLDEPFAALDALNRLRMQEVLADAFGDLGPTVVMVTHDVDEAIRLADRIVLLGGQPAGVRAVHPVPERGDTAGALRLRHDILAGFGLEPQRSGRHAAAASA
ncbi:MAG: ABC transporter ATP-binding protein [Thermomicrobiales bacterium]|nr:ABC transporter ATP-binding protein [Thermomicrobiales bacterium]